MKLHLMTDLEGVAGVLDFEEWTGPGKLHYQAARKLLTQEVNAAVAGFFEGGHPDILPLHSGPKIWGERRDLNPRPPEPQSGALPLSYAHHTQRSRGQEHSSCPFILPFWHARQDSNLRPAA